MVPNDPKNRFYYGKKNDNYYGFAQPKIPENNKGTILNGNFYPIDESTVTNGYYKRQMAANEFKDYTGPRAKANNERPEDEQLDPRIIDTANFILQHQEKMKQRLRDKYRKNNIAFKKKHENVVSISGQLYLTAFYLEEIIWKLRKFTRQLRNNKI